MHECFFYYTFSDINDASLDIELREKRPVLGSFDIPDEIEDAGNCSILVRDF